MKAKIIRKQDIAKFLDNMLKEYEVIAPVRKGALVVFDQIHSGSEAWLDFTNSIKPPKEVVLPQVETLFNYSSTNNKVDIKVSLPQEKPRLVFGIRPCDAKSFLFLNRVFNEERYRDVYFLNRREAIVVAIGCGDPRATCFCTSVSGGPFSTDGSDLLLIDIGDSYIVQVVTDKGASLLDRVNLEDAKEENLSLMRKLIQDVEASMAPKIQLNELKDKLDKIFHDPKWDSLTEKCLSCGVCTYLCPTCYCFDIVDEGRNSKGERCRIWDSCQFPLFTLQASGVNPRPTSKERYRQRIMHKFSYCLDNEGQVGCVGCGRCITECPVNLDIRQVLTAILNVEATK